MDPREEIRARISLKDVVSRYVELRPAGRGRYKGLCPFHKEKTPSFYVDDEKGLFYCFGCKTGGDVFTFLEKIEGLTFQEALTRLAEEAGVELPQRKAPKKDKDLYAINQLALEFFRKNLGEKAWDYLKKRGIEPFYAEAFKLGYAPPGWQNLTRYLSESGIPLEKALAAGVVAEKEGRVYDRFRDRLIVPIEDHAGRVVGFSGRSLSGEEPKYLNTPETEIFKKREILFGLPQAREAIREKKRAIVVEGLFDVVALHQMGFRESVAVLGSAFTPEQGLLLKRLGVRELYLAFDADEAGRKATLKSLELEVAKSFKVYAVALPEGKDPGDLLLLANGKELFERALENALSEVEFRLEEATRGVDVKTPEGKRRVLEALLPRLVEAEPFDPVAEELKALIIDRLDLLPETLDELIQRKRRSKSREVTTAEVLAASKGTSDRVRLLELDIIALLLNLPPEVFPRFVRLVANEVSPPEESLLAEFLRAASEEGYDPRRVQSRVLARDEEGALFERLVLAEPPELEELEDLLKKSLARLREGYLKRELELLKQKLAAGPDPETLAKIQELQRQIERERRRYRAQA